MDIELEYADRLSSTLRDMRRDLTDEASERVLMWALNRWGIAVSTKLLINRVPEVRRTGTSPAVARAPTLPPPEDDDEESAANTALTCHVCGKVCEDRRGLSAHLRFKHKVKTNIALA